MFISMSRQYMSTFRQKLNPDNQLQLTKRDSGTSALSKTCSKSSSVSRDLMSQPVRTSFSNKAKLERTTNDADKRKATGAVRRSKVQVDILESALATLRIKEKRALRELESEMRRYKKTIDTNSKKARKTNVSRYSWNVQSFLHNNDEGMLKRGRNSEDHERLVSDHSTTINTKQ